MSEHTSATQLEETPCEGITRERNELRAEVKRLRAALEAIVSFSCTSSRKARAIAYKALVREEVYLLGLCRDYISLVDSQRSGAYDAQDNHDIGGQRSQVHDELLRLTGLTRATDMYAWCKQGLSEAQGEG